MSGLRLPVLGAPGLFGGVPLTDYSKAILALSPIRYWILGESGGAVAKEQVAGDDSAITDVTWGSPGIGDGNTAALFNGTTSFVEIYSAALNTAFDGALFSIAGWLRVVDAGVWTDATGRVAIQVGAGASNRAELSRRTTDNHILGLYRAGGVLTQIIHVAGPSTNWIHMAITVTKAGDAAKIYVDGAQSGSTLTGLGVWAGALSAVSTGLGKSWKGTLAHWGIWDRVLSDAEVLELANPT